MASDNSRLVLARACGSLFGAVFFFIVLGHDARAQTPEPLTTSKSVTATSVISAGTKSSTTSTSSTIASTSTAADLFEATDADAKPLDLSGLENQNIWVPYSTEKELQALTTKLIEHMNRQHLELAEIVLLKIQRIQATLGLKNIPMLSMSLVRDARVIDSRGENLLALRFLKSAAIMSPDLSQIHLVRLKIALKNQPLSVNIWSKIILDYLQSRVTGFRNQSSLAFDSILVFLSAILISILLFSLVQFVKYFRYILFFVAKYSPDWLSQTHVGLMFILLLSAPLVLGIGWILPLGSILAILWSFQREGERKIGIFCWMYLVAAPAILVILGAFLAEKRSIDEDIISLLRDSNPSSARSRVLRYVETKDGSKDVNAVLAIAQAAWFQGDLDSSKSRYLEALALKPNDVAILSNLGRILFFRRETEASKERFSQAMQAATHAEPMLNYASLLLDEGRFEEAQAAVRKAGTVDLKRARYYGSLPVSVSTAEKMLLIEHSDHFAWSRMWSREPANLWSVGLSLFRESGNPQNPLIISSFLIFFGIIGVVVSRKRKQIGIYTPCVKCGRPTQWVSSESHCDQCQSVFLRSTAVDPNKRRIKKGRVKKYQQGILYIERLMSGVPGLPEVFTDQAVLGFFRLVVFFCAVTGFLFAPLFDTGSTSIGLQTKQYAEVMFGLCIFFMILFSLRRSFRG